MKAFGIWTAFQTLARANRNHQSIGCRVANCRYGTRVRSALRSVPGFAASRLREDNYGRAASESDAKYARAEAKSTLRPGRVSPCAWKVIALVWLTLAAPSAFAQQYCVSGAVTSVQSCNGCNINVGDPVAMTFTVAPGATCVAILGECIGQTSIAANIGAQYWSSPASGYNQAEVSSSSINLGGTAVSVSGVTDASSALYPTFSIIGAGLNLFAGGTFPASLPTPAEVASAKAFVSFYASTELGGSPQFSYTGQTCATAPTINSPPTITLVQNAEGGASTIAPNTWVTLKGSSLAPVGDSRIWQTSDFVNSQLPTQLDGVSVTLNGEKAFVYYISPTQINILTPPDLTAGTDQVQVATKAGNSASFTVQVQAESPSFFIFGGGPYVAATHSDGSLIGPATLYPGSTTPAQPGETIVLYANGFGKSATPVTSGSETQSGNLNPAPVITVGGTPATVVFAGLISPGLFQFNVVVPASASVGDKALTATYNGLITQSGVLVTIGQ